MLKDTNIIKDMPLTLSIQQLNTSGSSLFALNQEGEEEQQKNSSCQKG